MNWLLFRNSLYKLTCLCDGFPFKNIPATYDCLALAHAHRCHCQMLSTFLMLLVRLVRRSKSCHNILPLNVRCFPVCWIIDPLKSFHCKINRSIAIDSQQRRKYDQKMTKFVLQFFLWKSYSNQEKNGSKWINTAEKCGKLNVECDAIILLLWTKRQRPLPVWIDWKTLPVLLAVAHWKWILCWCLSYCNGTTQY